MKRKFILLVIAVVIVVGIIIFLVYQQGLPVNYEKIASNLVKRLRSQGVAVKSVEVLSTDPFQIEIIIPAADLNDSQSRHDQFRAIYLTQWKVEQLNHDHFLLTSYILNITDDAGETIEKEHKFLYPKEKSDKPVDEQTYAMGVSEAEAYLREQLDFGTS